MSEVPEILLPTETRTVSLGKVPMLIARALHPDQPEGQYVLKSMDKAYLGPKGVSDGRTRPCSEEELKLAEEILGESLPLGKEILASDLDALQNKFAQSPRRPEWVLAPLVINGHLNATMLRLDAEELHRKALIKAIRDEALVPLDHALLPLHKSVREALDIGQVFLETFCDYVAKFGISVKANPVDMRLSASTWTIGRFLKEEADYSYTSHGYKEVTRERKRALTAVIEDLLRSDLRRLVLEGAISPIQSPTHGPPAGPSDPLNDDWMLTRDDLETALRFSRMGVEHKRDYLLERKRHKGSGRYTLKEAAKAICAGSGERYDAVLNRLVSAAAQYELPTYELGRFQRLVYGKGRGEVRAVRDFYDEVYWYDLNGWLDAENSLIPFRFDSPPRHNLGEEHPARGNLHGDSRLDAEPKGAAALKLRRDLLDPAIDKAIEQAGSFDVATVYLNLRELALSEAPPFTGSIDGDALCYTDAKNNPSKLSRDALGKRLKRRAPTSATSR